MYDFASLLEACKSIHVHDDKLFLSKVCCSHRQLLLYLSVLFIRHTHTIPRPPGHHAECAFAMGFSLFNSIAVAAKHAVEKLGLKR